MKDKVNIHDVARKAGVSQPTVSKVINQYSGVSQTTRRKVLQAIEELGFTPDAIARSLVRSKSDTIGLIVGDIANPFYAETAKVVIREAQARGYETIVLDTDYDNDNFDKCLQTLMSKRVDGILVGSVTRFNEKVKEIYDSGFPIVLYNRNLDKKLVHCVEVDNETGTMLALRHLQELGHRRIAYISGPINYSTFYSRYLGYMSGVHELGLDPNHELAYNGVYEYDSVFEFARKLMESGDCPTAFLVASDRMAMAVMDAASRSGLSVPGDVSIVGYDNIDLSAHALIGLTTVSMQKEKMAQLALGNLVALIEANEAAAAPMQVTLKPELIVRRTTSFGPAAAPTT